MRQIFSLIRRQNLPLLASLIFLTAVQAWQTFAFQERLHLEDAAESLRGPYWWSAHHTIYNGIASSVGYYATLSAAYNIFGFSVYLAKWLRVGLQLISLLAIAELFRRWLGPKLAIIPLLVAGLSPTFLYLNTYQCELGLDLQFFPILLLAALKLPMRFDRGAIASALFFGMALIWPALIYPVALFYFPPIALFLIWRWRQQNPNKGWLGAIGLACTVACGCILPILACLWYAKNPQLLIYDRHVQAGVFRGGGTGITFDPGTLLWHINTVLRDLFIEGGSYLFYIPKVEFGTWLGRIAFTLVTMGLVRAISRKRDPLLIWLFCCLAFVFVPPLLVEFQPGLRRCTGFFFAYYGFVAYVWNMAWTWPEDLLPKSAKTILGIGVIVQLLSNAITLTENAKEGLAIAGSRNFSWFSREGGIAKSLEYWDTYSRSGQALKCGEFNFASCRYAEIYGAIESNRYWNHLPKSPILGWDPKKNTNRNLDISLWETNEMPH